MTPCPLCLLGFEDSHSKEDWDRLAEDEELNKKLVKILSDLNHPGARVD